MKNQKPIKDIKLEVLKNNNKDIQAIEKRRNPLIIDLDNPQDIAGSSEDDVELDVLLNGKKVYETEEDKKFRRRQEAAALKQEQKNLKAQVKRMKEIQKQIRKAKTTEVANFDFIEGWVPTTKIEIQFYKDLEAEKIAMQKVEQEALNQKEQEENNNSVQQEQILLEAKALKLTNKQAKKQMKKDKKTSQRITDNNSKDFSQKIKVEIIEMKSVLTEDSLEESLTEEVILKDSHISQQPVAELIEMKEITQQVY